MDKLAKEEINSAIWWLNDAADQLTSLIYERFNHPDWEQWQKEKKHLNCVIDYLMELKNNS